MIIMVLLFSEAVLLKAWPVDPLHLDHLGVLVTDADF